jgi:predicted transcriptional regulator of viral defense system
MSTLTTLENKLLRGLTDSLDRDEPTFSNIYVDDLEEITSIPMNTLRGVLGSLIKKGYIYIASYGADMDIVHLEEKHFNLI